MRKQMYSTHEREMISVVPYLHIWRVYLLATHFVVRIDNVENIFFKKIK